MFFIVNGDTVKFFSEEKLVDTLLKFVRLSNKKEQQKTIDEIKDILKTVGPNGFT